MKAIEGDSVKGLRFLADDSDLLLAIIFGSQASGKDRFDSDIDVAVYPSKALDASEQQHIADRIAVVAGRPVDLVDLSTVDGALLRQVLCTGGLLFSKQAGLLGALSERMLDWQENFEPQMQKLLDARFRRFTAPRHGS